MDTVFNDFVYFWVNLWKRMGFEQIFEIIDILVEFCDELLYFLFLFNIILCIEIELIHHELKYFLIHTTFKQNQEPLQIIPIELDLILILFGLLRFLPHRDPFLPLLDHILSLSQFNNLLLNFLTKIILITDQKPQILIESWLKVLFQQLNGLLLGVKRFLLQLLGLGLNCDVSVEKLCL